MECENIGSYFLRFNFWRSCLTECSMFSKNSRTAWYNVCFCFLFSSSCEEALWNLAFCLSVPSDGSVRGPAKQSAIHHTNQLVTKKASLVSGSNESRNVTIKTLATLCFSCCPTFVKRYRGRLEVALQ